MTTMLIGLSTVFAFAQMEFIEDSAKGILTLRDGRTDVLTYCFGDQLKKGVDRTQTRSSYIHPLFSPDGRALTADFPEDHLHHHGLFWAWPVIKTRGQETSNWAPSTPPLRQRFARWLGRKAGAEEAVLSVENIWELQAKEVVAREIVTVRVYRADLLGRLIDLEIQIEAAGGPLEIQGTPDQNKGYGGLCFRGAAMFQGAAMTTDEGRLKEDSVNRSFRWADLSSADCGVAIFVAPSHPGFPTAWLIRNSYGGLLNPCWPGLEPVVFQPGQPVTLRYRIYVHRGDADSGGVREAYEKYLSLFLSWLPAE
ncbi:MAG: PmoA family protein [Acidobacteriota bacterium]